MTEPKRPASIREAAAHAGVDVVTIYRWRAAGRLTSYKREVGGGPGRPRIVLDLDEVDKLTELRPAANE